MAGSSRPTAKFRRKAEFSARPAINLGSLNPIKTERKIIMQNVHKFQYAYVNARKNVLHRSVRVARSCLQPYTYYIDTKTITMSFVYVKEPSAASLSMAQLGKLRRRWMDVVGDGAVAS